MLQSTIQLDGLTELQAKFDSSAFEAIVELALGIVAEELRDRITANSPVYAPQVWDKRPPKQRHEPGLFKMSWTYPEKEGPLLFTFRNPVEYGPVLEEGLFPRKMLVAVRADGTPGRLIDIDGKLYSRMTNDGIGGPVVAPIVANTANQERIMKLVLQQLVEHFSGD